MLLRLLQNLTGWYNTAQFRCLMAEKNNTWKRVVPFLDSMRVFPYDADLCMREFLKSLTGLAYIWYFNLKPCLVHGWKHLVSLSALKQSLLLLVSVERLIPRKDQDAYLRRSHENAWNCCYPMTEEVLVDVCLHDMMEEYRVF